MNYSWINPYEIPALDDLRVVLFGAGQGSWEFIDFANTYFPDARISGLVDNDVSIHGNSFNGLDIFHPERLKDVSFDLIIVTSISGRDSIACQLESMGFNEGVNFFLVGRYPDSFLPAIDLFVRYYPKDPELFMGSSCLNIGPGGRFDLEILFYCYGAHVVFSIDKYRFGNQYPDVSEKMDDLKNVRKYIFNIKDESYRKYMLKRFDSLFIHGKNRCRLDEDKIRFVYPMDVCEMRFPDNSFDFVFSSGVFEHVKFPERAVSEIMRVLKSGGVTLNKVITTDHRSYLKCSDYNPFSFRIYSEQEWENISSKKFYQNRVIPAQWRRMFIENGMTISAFEVENILNIDDFNYNEFHSDFKVFSKSELGETDCIIVGLNKQ